MNRGSVRVCVSVRACVSVCACIIECVRVCPCTRESVCGMVWCVEKKSPQVKRVCQGRALFKPKN